jgi:hypothetical protein
MAIMQFHRLKVIRPEDTILHSSRVCYFASMVFLSSSHVNCHKTPAKDVRFEFCAFHASDVSSRGLLGCDAVQCCGGIPMFQWSMLPPSSGLHEVKMEAAWTS